MSKKTEADRIADFIYTFLEQRMTSEAFETLLKKGWYARGSMSFHGFMGMLNEIHDARKRLRVKPKIEATDHIVESK